MIDVCFCADSNFLKPLEVALYSLIINSRGKVRVHIVKIDDFDERNISKLISQYGHEIMFYNLDVSFKEKGRFSKAIYGRLYIDRLLPDSIKRVIYIDCDTVIKTDLSQLWTMELNSNVLAACPEPPSVIKDHLLRKFNLDDYFNSGVILIDLCLVREKNVFINVCNLLSVREDFEYPDQDALNIILGSKWLKLPNVFNFMELEYSSTAVIVHYALSKPWVDSYNKNSYLYKEYVRLYPYTLPFFKQEFQDNNGFISNFAGWFLNLIRTVYWKYVKK